MEECLYSSQITELFSQHPVTADPDRQGQAVGHVQVTFGSGGHSNEGQSDHDKDRKSVAVLSKPPLFSQQPFGSSGAVEPSMNSEACQESPMDIFIDPCYLPSMGCGYADYLDSQYSPADFPCHFDNDTRQAQPKLCNFETNTDTYRSNELQSLNQAFSELEEK